MENGAKAMIHIKRTYVLQELFSLKSRAFQPNMVVGDQNKTATNMYSTVSIHFHGLKNWPIFKIQHGDDNQKKREKKQGKI